MSKEISIHPLLGNLWDYVKNSSNKIEHGVLDAAGSATSALGGGGVIYCKSGKDRTGMGVTLRESQWLAENNSFTGRSKSTIYDDATLLRFGTRLAICEKNIGVSRYAFNSLQARFMPEMLKPPPETLANLFDRESKIET